MPIVQSELQRIYANLDMSLVGALNQHPDVFAKQVTMLTGEGRQKILPYLGSIGAVREFVGPRVLNDLATRVQLMNMRKWEDSFRMPEDDVEDQSQFPFFSAAAAGIGEQFAIHRNRHYTETLLAGLTTTWSVDGQYFYDSDHPRNPDAPGVSTFSNRFDTASGDARALTAANFDYVWNAFRSIKNETGDPMVLGEIVIEVPQALETKARQICEDAMIVPAVAVGINAANILQPNPNKGRAVVQVNPWLDATSTTRWFLHCVGRVVKPYIWWDGRPVRSAEFVRHTDLPVFLDGNYIYGADAKYVCAPSMPHLSCTADV
jgi:phage major head subunit gpT-like protein